LFLSIIATLFLNAHLSQDEEGAIKTLEERIHLAPSLSVDMLRHKVFGAFTCDEEFRLIAHSSWPLYSEKFDPNEGLKKTLNTVFRAETHSE
jgi:proline iminopeptidase